MESYKHKLVPIAVLAGVIAAGLVVVLVGIAMGWDTDTWTAVGTWVAGIGTAGAVGWAVRVSVDERSDRQRVEDGRRDDRERERVREERAQAQMHQLVD